MARGDYWFRRWLRAGDAAALVGNFWFRRWVRRADGDAIEGEAWFRRAVRAGETGLPELVLINRTAGTNIGNMTGSAGLAAAFDGETAEANANCASLASATDAFIGKTLAGTKVFGQAIAYGSNAAGFSSLNIELTLRVYGKTGAAPANSADGTVVGTLVFTDTANESAGRVIESTDLVAAWDHLWLRITGGSASTLRVAELVLYEWA